MKNEIILLFEDDNDKRENRLKSIKVAAGKSTKVIPFNELILSEYIYKTKTYEGKIEEILINAIEKERIGLIVCDYELSALKDFIGISGSVILSIAEKMAIPICMYTSGETNDSKFMLKRKNWEKGTIILDDNTEKFGIECVGIYKGFQLIAELMQKIKKNKFNEMTAAEFLANILEREREADRIALYGSGEQDLLSEIMADLQDVNDEKDIEEIRKKRYPRILGNWLYTSILRFPGILVNEIAASSYLHISAKDFNKQEIQNLFKKAKYSGPFAACGDWWWRKDLDEIIDDDSSTTGLDFVKKTFPKTKESKCIENEDHVAGFYCMFSRKPVCEEHSRGSISWFPAGADLARISLKEYKKIGPFLGLY